jgi:hypothetical protein
MDRALSARAQFEARPIEDKFKSLFEEYKRRAQEEVLYDVMTQFYFADWTRKCDYDNMTSEEVVEAAMSVCKKLEERWNYSLDDDIF